MWEIRWSLPFSVFSLTIALFLSKTSSFSVVLLTPTIIYRYKDLFVHYIWYNFSFTCAKLHNLRNKDSDFLFDSSDMKAKNQTNQPLTYMVVMNLYKYDPSHSMASILIQCSYIVEKGHNHYYTSLMKPLSLLLFILLFNFDSYSKFCLKRPLPPSETSTTLFLEVETKCR